MTHQNTNQVNLDNIFEKARTRKAVMELQEIENLLQKTQPVKKAFGKWRNLSLLILAALFIGLGASRYFRVEKTGAGSHEKLTFKKEKAEKPVVASEEGNKAEMQNAAPVAPLQNASNEPRQKRQTLSTKTLLARKEKSSSSRANKSTLNNPPNPGYSEAVFNNTTTHFSFKGWELGTKVPAQFGYGLDKEVAFSGTASAYIKAKKSNYNSAWLTQQISAAPYIGKRLKMTAMVKSENAGKKAWAGIFMNIKGDDFKLAGYDNLYDKKISGQSGWVNCEIVMDIPAGAKSISFGLYKVYDGMAWIDNIAFETVSKDTPTHFLTRTEVYDTSLVQPDISTEIRGLVVEKPANLNFEKSKINELPDGWYIGEEKQHFRAIADGEKPYSGKASALLQSNGFIEKDWNTLMQFCKAGKYLQKRLKVTAWVRTQDLKEHASFIFRVDGLEGTQDPDNIKERTFTGSNSWRKVELVLDIPDGANYISYGIALAGKGKVWMDDISIEEIPQPANAKPKVKQAVNLGFEE